MVWVQYNLATLRELHRVSLVLLLLSWSWKKSFYYPFQRNLLGINMMSVASSNSKNSPSNLGTRTSTILTPPCTVYACSIRFLPGIYKYIYYTSTLPGMHINISRSTRAYRVLLNTSCMTFIYCIMYNV